MKSRGAACFLGLLGQGGVLRLLRKLAPRSSFTSHVTASLLSLAQPGPPCSSIHKPTAPTLNSECEQPQAAELSLTVSASEVPGKQLMGSCAPQP